MVHFELYLYYTQIDRIITDELISYGHSTIRTQMYICLALLLPIERNTVYTNNKVPLER